MALFDSEQQKIILRIVYDGAERAGKTTNVTQLCSFFSTLRRSDVYTPEVRDGRTIYFDWMQLEAGLIAGYRIRCQLLTVPGQSGLSRRRWQLLKTADAVVFVCDSTPEGIEAARPMFNLVRDYLKSLTQVEIPLVLQANKQDMPGALDPHAVAAGLGFDRGGMLVGARASEGVGVRDTVVLAIRSAANVAERVVLERGADALAGTEETGEALYAWMRGEEAQIIENPEVERQSRAEAERRAREAADRAEGERQAREEAARAQAEAREASARAEGERRAREASERAEAERAEERAREAYERAEAQAAAARAEAERRAREAAERAEVERRAQAAAARAEVERQAREAEARAEAERQAREAEARAEAERQAREAAARAEAERRVREAAARAEAERQAREAAARAEAEAREAYERAEAERQAREAAERAEVERQAREAAERAEAEAREAYARAEAERHAREAAERAEAEAREAFARAEAERQAREAAERAEAEAREAYARAEAERHAREATERAEAEAREAIARAEAERHAREAAERSARRKATEAAERAEAEARAAEARAEAERQVEEAAARAEMEAREAIARADAERQTREADRRIRETAARAEADRHAAIARAEAERQAVARAEAERADAERRARDIAERQAARAEAERQAAAQARPATQRVGITELAREVARAAAERQGTIIGIPDPAGAPFKTRFHAAEAAERERAEAARAARAAREAAERADIERRTAQNVIRSRFDSTDRFAAETDRRAREIAERQGAARLAAEPLSRPPSSEAASRPFDSMSPAGQERQAKMSAERAEVEKMTREAAERREGERRAREAAERVEAERRMRDAAEKAATERQAREAAEQSAAERNSREAAARADAQRRAREAAERAAAGGHVGGGAELVPRGSAPFFVSSGGPRDASHAEPPPSWRGDAPITMGTQPPPSSVAAGSTYVLLASGIVPPMPRADVGIGFIWPSATGRDILRRVMAAGHIVRRDDVVIQRMKLGSGLTDEIIFQTGSYCLKTSLSRRFADLDEGRTELLKLARKKMQTGRLVPDTAVLSIQPEDSGGAWLWSVMPWLQTLQASMEEAAVQRDEAKLTEALVSYAEGAAEALIVAARQRLILNVHPDNFARSRNDLYYVDDNISQGSRIPDLGHAILQRCVDYAAFPSAVNSFITMFATYVGRSINRKLMDDLGVDEAFAEEALISPLARPAQEKLFRLLGR